jgi:hypothetical protein
MYRFIETVSLDATPLLYFTAPYVYHIFLLAKRRNFAKIIFVSAKRTREPCEICSYLQHLIAIISLTP